MKSVHACSLPPRDMWGFPKLPPNAPWYKRLARNLRKFTAPNHTNARSQLYFYNKSAQVIEARRYATSSHFYVIHPFSNCAAVVETLFFISWFISFIVDPLVVFHNVKTIHRFDETMDRYALFPVQRAVVVSFFLLGYVDKDNQIITEPKKIIKRYLTTYFIFDVTAAEFFTRLVEICSQPFLPADKDFYREVCRIFIILCYYVRFNTVLETLAAITQHLSFPKRVQSVVVYLLRTFIIMHLCCCIIYAVPKSVYVSSWPKESWLAQAGVHGPSNATFHDKYLECFLVVVCYYFGASHNMYEVSIPIEQLSLSVITLIGRVHTLFLLADLLKLFGVANVSVSAYEQQLSHLEEYMISKNLPVKLRKRLMKYYDHTFQKHCFNEAEIFATVSEHLRTELFLHAARNLISRVFIFKSLPKGTLGNIISLLKLDTYAPRDVVIKVGEQISDVFFISSGTVAVLNKAGMELCHLEDSDEFGIISIVTDEVQMYQVEAVETTDIFRMRRGKFFRLIGQYEDVVEQMNSMVKKRFDMLKTIEETIMRGGSSVLSDLRKGNILEHFHKRPEVSD